MATKPGKTVSSPINDPARTTAGILEVAIAEFAEKGLSGARRCSSAAGDG